MSLHLRPETEARLAALAAASGVSVADYLEALVEKQYSSGQTAPSAEQGAASRPGQPVWEMIVENMKNVPPEDFESLPKDGLSQIDHYVYGVPKRTS